VSPDGKKLAYLKSVDSRMNVFVRDISDEKSEKQVTFLKDRDVSQFFWKESQLFYLKDFGGDENFHLFSIDLKTLKDKDVTPFDKTRVSIIDVLKFGDSQSILISHNQRDAKVFDVYKLNIKTLKTDLIVKNPGDYESYISDEKGQIRLVTRSVGVDTEILYRDNNQQKFKSLLKFDYTRGFNPIVIHSRDTKFLAVSNLTRDKAALVEFDTTTKKETKIIYQNLDYDFDGAVIYSERSKKLMGLSITTWKNENIFFDPGFEAMYGQVEALFKEKNKIIKNISIGMISSDKAENYFTFGISGDRSRGEFYLYNREKNKITLIQEAAPWLKADSLVETKPIQFLSRDGLTIHGYLTLPQNYTGKPIAAIVNPHGGPWARDVWRFNAENQFLASRGYAVLQINFRGSTGYGRDFLKASYKQWGLKMQDDITDGTQWLIKQGYAHPQKICIYGGSYGGYATLMGLVKEPDLYACGVDYVGVSNLFTFLKTIPPYWSTFKEKMNVMLGDEVKDKDQFIQTSPVYHVDKIKAPLFIAQGAKDPRVNKDESDQVVKKLKERGIEVPYLVKDEEGHGFRNEENRFEFYTQMENFLEKHLK
jgi:prolyl oligopeptidase PreP (S9A serine peptidase family)